VKFADLLEKIADQDPLNEDELARLRDVGDRAEMVSLLAKDMSPSYGNLNRQIIGPVEINRTGLYMRWGKVELGAGTVTIDDSGISIDAGEFGNNEVKWYDANGEKGGRLVIIRATSGGQAGESAFFMEAISDADKKASVTIRAREEDLVSGMVQGPILSMNSDTAIPMYFNNTIGTSTYYYLSHSIVSGQHILIFNGATEDFDFKFYSGHAFVLAPLMTEGSTGNVALFRQNTNMPNFQSGVGIAFVRNRYAAPTGNPTSGGYLYAQAGALIWRGSSGTITTVAPA